eukprot:6265422-Karenia_brevis.AAC.1
MEHDFFLLHRHESIDIHTLIIQQPFPQGNNPLDSTVDGIYFPPPGHFSLSPGPKLQCSKSCGQEEEERVPGQNSSESA